MNLKALAIGACLVIAASWGASPSEARQAGPQGGRQQGPRAGMRAGAGPVVAPAELERWLDAYVLLQAQDTLKLTDAQFPRFLQRLKALQELRRRQLRERRQTLATLGSLMRATPFDEAAARERLKALRDLDLRSFDDLQKARAAVDEVLDVQQQARFRLFEEAVERRKIDLLMRARQRAGERGQAAPPAIK